jgi:hypothetical protein
MTYIKLNPSDVVIDSQKVTSPAWDGKVPILRTFYTPNISDNGFYVDVYKDSLTANPFAKVQFSIAFCNQSGSGNVTGANYQTSDGTKFTKITYGSLRQKVLNSEMDYFTFNNPNGVAMDSIHVISLDRSVYKESVKGGFNLTLKNGLNELKLTDDSKVDTVNNYIGNNRYYNIISGTNGKLATNQNIINTVHGTYGIILPDSGIIILNSLALALPVAQKGIGLTINDSPTNITQRNEINLLNLIQAGSTFEVYSEETVTSKYYFCRATSGELNYTTNPSIIDGNGNIYDQSLIDFPVTYVTTLGLYNSKHELVGVGKISKPMRKSFVEDLTIKTKVSW